VELRGERVLLRSLRGDDRAALAALIADPAIADWWGEDEIAIDHGTDEEPVHQLAIELDGELIGYIQGYEQLGAQYRYAGIDLFLDPRWQGHGLGTEALRVLARWLIDDRGHHRLVIDPRADNARAIASYTKVGFRPVGVLRRYDRGRDGVLRDGLLMDLLADELVDGERPAGGA
jgi:aminoglycoside 6'-N-acetyltransferase